MLEPGGDLDLAEEALRADSAREIGMQHLERHRAVVPRDPGPGTPWPCPPGPARARSRRRRSRSPAAKPGARRSCAHAGDPPGPPSAARRRLLAGSRRRARRRRAAARPRPRSAGSSSRPAEEPARRSGAQVERPVQQRLDRRPALRRAERPSVPSHPELRPAREQPGPRLDPVPLHRPGGHAQRLRGLLLGESAEVAALHHLAQPLVHAPRAGRSASSSASSISPRSARRLRPRRG